MIREGFLTYPHIGGHVSIEHYNLRLPDSQVTHTDTQTQTDTHRDRDTHRQVHTQTGTHTVLPLPYEAM